MSLAGEKHPQRKEEPPTKPFRLLSRLETTAATAAHGVYDSVTPPPHTGSKSSKCRLVSFQAAAETTHSFVEAPKWNHVIHKTLHFVSRLSRVSTNSPEIVESVT